MGALGQRANFSDVFSTNDNCTNINATGWCDA